MKPRSQENKLPDATSITKTLFATRSRTAFYGHLRLPSRHRSGHPKTEYTSCDNLIPTRTHTGPYPCPKKLYKLPAVPLCSTRRVLYNLSWPWARARLSPPLVEVGLQRGAVVRHLPGIVCSHRLRPFLTACHKETVFVLTLAARKQKLDFPYRLAPFGGHNFS